MLESVNRILLVMLRFVELVSLLMSFCIGMRAVSNFIEVATSTTGEGDYYLEKLAMLHEVATGYSSLIFDVNSSMGFNDLCIKCRSLWKALEENSELPQYLVCLLQTILKCIHIQNIN